MSFISQEPKRTVGPDGPIDAKIAFIGEAPAKDEFAKGRPFVGPAGNIFETCLHAAGMIRAECYVTNLIKESVPYGHIGKYFSQTSAKLTERGNYWADELTKELRATSANILVPLGGPATAAILGDGNRVTTKRGYVTRASDRFEGRKAMPSLHPASAIHGGKWVNTYYITHDFLKASKQRYKPEVEYDEWILHSPVAYGDAIHTIRQFNNKSPLAYDIEVINYEVASISFSCDDMVAASIPIAHNWSVEEEAHIWYEIAALLENPNTTKIIHNGMFDVAFLWEHNRIQTKGPIHDTMIGHHIVYPDFLKSLSFVLSIYKNVPFWKDMVKFDNIKDES